jgi:Nucleotide-diphospho-sugar transferase
MIICAYEDRPSDWVGLKLLVLSVAQQCPGVSIHLFCPTATAEFQDWLQQYPQVHLRSLPTLKGQGWNVKPDLLLSLLNEGHQDVIWIDSDIIVNRDFRSLLATVTSDTLVVAQEHRWETHNSAEFTQGWGLPFGRELGGVICSCFLRVTPAHQPLLQAWKQCLAHPQYLQAQVTWPRPVHMIGDQDVLTALLGSSQFAGIPIHWLRRGRDIAQCFRECGYTVGERLTNLFGLPALVHAQGPKPWRNAHEETFLELAPYSAVAQRYRSQLDEDTTWITVHSQLGKVYNRLTFGHPSLRGLPFALWAEIKRASVKAMIKTLLKRFKPLAAQPITDDLDPASEVDRLSAS